ncbi:MAG: HAD-IA family hydrolase [Muribaculaceae bacterium]|nr:HAD-IA family hydrolase [Muribaculaceae bacterium]
MLKNKKYALIDMDGVLYDSMRYHTKAWHQLMDELGLHTTREEFYLYEGMTGTDTINLIFKRERGYTVSPEQARELYARKARIFIEYGSKEVMPGAQQMIDNLLQAGIRCVLVTGSAQNSLISRLDDDFPGAFPHDMRVTALDVTHGKPDPEPYLKGLAKTGVSPEEVFVIENAPLGVRAAKAAGLDTVAVTTGPIPRKAFEEEKADLIFDSMPQFAARLPELLN